MEDNPLTKEQQNTSSKPNSPSITHNIVSHRPRMETLECQSEVLKDTLSDIFEVEWNKWYARIGNTEREPSRPVQLMVMLTLCRDEIRRTVPPKRDGLRPSFMV